MSTTFQSVGANDASPAASKWRNLTAFIMDAFDAMAEARRSQQAVAALRGLDDRMLKDIGIDRSEIESLVYSDRGERIR